MKWRLALCGTRMKKSAGRCQYASATAREVEPPPRAFFQPQAEKCSDDSGGESRNQKSGNQPAHGGQNIVALPKKQSGARIKRSRYGNRLHVSFLLIGYVGGLVRKEPVAEKALQASFAQVFA